MAAESIPGLLFALTMHDLFERRQALKSSMGLLMQKLFNYGFDQKYQTKPESQNVAKFRPPQPATRSFCR